ncbi:MAG: hypothetical protein E7223_05335 [Clostridiales bacterium]|nr:hypothetical protein [Clostridiales bacterium]
MSEEKKQKQVRNKWADVITDYYRTNRQIHKQDQERYAREKAEGKKEPWTKREILMLAVCILCGIGIILRWFLCEKC